MERVPKGRGEEKREGERDIEIDEGEKDSI